MLAQTDHEQTSPRGSAGADAHEWDPEPAVSLSAATIIDILRQEPGLLLEVKRVLVRKAYEQGRLLDPADLTDEALFQLLREDDNVRVLTTREIERRDYVRAKPTRQELQKDRIAKTPGSRAVGQNEEEKYWSQHEKIENGRRGRRGNRAQRMVSPTMASSRLSLPVRRRIVFRRHPRPTPRATIAGNRAWLASVSRPEFS